eukprot:CAMPEP_0118653250 /NCGR_PEP_ID=MMETSP0785-20121206/11735_1 /TAXON_ID=91992 /ORGANISM="Bolidomonas pacifica, Strain CCMP 1866" /LENGTH=47 /DNA_ID= /DNA_START= /DNA_END= /DNA_ORIENTATION=
MGRGREDWCVDDGIGDDIDRIDDDIDRIDDDIHEYLEDVHDDASTRA